MVYRARKLADTNVKLSLPGESVVEFTLGSVGAGEAPSTKVPGGADATTASTKKSSAIPDLPGIKPAPPEAYGKAYVIGGVRSPKPLPKQPEDVLLMKRDDGKNIRDIRLLLNEDGSIEINTCDSGEAPEQFFGHEDYEWWVKIAQENISRLAAALLKEKFGERFDTSDAFKTFYTTAGVAKENKTRLAFALLKERFSGNFCATDEFGEICKAAGVPYEWSSYP